SAVELRLGKISASLAQDLVGLTQLAVLTLQGLELGGYVRDQARLAPAVALRPANPLMQSLCSAADLARNRDQRRPTRRMFMLVIENHPHRAASHLRRELVRCLACHGSTFSRVGASGKPGAVQWKLCGHRSLHRFRGGEAQPVASAARDGVRPWASFKILWARQTRPHSLATFSTPRKRN